MYGQNQCSQEIQVNTWQPMTPAEPKPLKQMVLTLNDISVPPKEPMKSMVQKFREKLPKFNYDQEPSDITKAREERREVTLPNGSRYMGEWSISTNKREGRGVQEWPDGSIYEGWWKNDMFHGHGRLIKSDLDVYVGEWKEDKAHGEGKFIHSNGATYIG